MITSELLEAYLACPMKCYLQSNGEKCSENTFAALYQTQKDSYRHASIRRLEADISQRSTRGQIEPQDLKKARWQLALDQAFDMDDLSANIHAIQRVPTKGRSSEFIPVRFVHLNKPSRANKMAAALDAIVLSKLTGQPISAAKIIHGDAWTTMKVRVAAHVRELTKMFGKMRVLLAAPSPPDLVLNRHCPECEFRDRCRKKAIEKDDLSLLTGLTDKERIRLNRRGIFTVNQLSHTFRPRQRPKRLAAQPEKYHHSLRALALREKKIHIVGKLRLPIHGTPIFFDVESLPDRDFYYLVGIRIEVDGHPTHHSFWANSLADERIIWAEFLAVVSAVEKPVLIHYGSFETKFLRKMCDRYGSPPDGSTAAGALASSLNLISPIFATVYFPTYSNGLKENARFLGFEWSDPTADGHQSIVWRHLWEQSHDPKFRDKLIAYNGEDCAALGVMARALGQLTDGEHGAREARPLSGEVVHADTVSGRASSWQPFKSPISDLEEINLAARWDYQRDRVFVRSGTAKRRATLQATRRPQTQRVQKIVLLNAPPACPRCEKKWRKRGRLRSRTVQDFIFGKHSIKRRIIQYEAQTYACRSCGYEYGLGDLRLHGRRWGWNILAYFIYNAIGLCIPQLTLQHSINRLFGCRLVRSSLNEFKIKASKLYSETKAKILDQIITGKLIHADETNANIKGRSAYVWVLTSLTDVVYILTESREGETVQGLLKGFRGVLVSDFYAAYESIACAQQKCLIHLMRDLNDEILNNPFDEEAKLVALRFAGLLRPIVDTIDRRGLRAHFLRKHLREVERFYGFLSRPLLLFVPLVAVSALGYLVMLSAFGPARWFTLGPFSAQASRLLLYFTYFVAGIWVGAVGGDRSLLAKGGRLARHWFGWLLAALAFYCLVVALEVVRSKGLIGLSPFASQSFYGFAFVLSCATTTFGFLSFFLRFANKPVPAFDALHNNAYGMYLIHYIFVIWLQYELLEVPLHAVAKATIVFIGTVILSFGIVATFRRIPAVARII